MKKIQEQSNRQKLKNSENFTIKIFYQKNKNKSK